MRGTDDTRLDVGKKDRLAIGGQDRKRDPRGGRDQGIGFLRLCHRPIHVDGCRGMDLMDTHQMVRADMQCVGHTCPIDSDDIMLGRAALAAVQPCKNAR